MAQKAEEPLEQRGHKRQSTALYRQIIDQLQDRIAFLGWPMWVCDEKSGLQDGYTAKLLHPDTASGRQATWQTLQLLIDALYPAGDFQLVIVPKSPRRPAKRGRQLPLGLEKLAPHPASVRTRRRNTTPAEQIRLRVYPQIVGQSCPVLKSVKPLGRIHPQAKPLLRQYFEIQTAECVGLPA